MAGIDEVLERLLTDAQFARHLGQDPASALAGYELTADDLTLLSTQVSFEPGALSLVEERISKSSFFGLLTSITGGLGGGGGGGQLPEPQYDPVPHLSPESHADVFYDMSPGIIGPDDSEGVVAPIDSQGLVDPSDHADVFYDMSPGIIGPDDTVGMVDPGSMGDPSFADPPEPNSEALDDWEVPADAGGGSIGDGDEFYFKEVEPGVPTPDGGAHGTGGGAGSEVFIKEVDPGVPTPDGGAGSEVAPDGGDHGTGGGAGSEVSFKEVDPADPPDPDRPGESQGFNPQPDPPGVTVPSDDAISPIAQGG